MKLELVKDFIDCRNAIIRLEISRYLLNQAEDLLASSTFDTLWVETDALLVREVNRLANMFTIDKSTHADLNQLAELIADRAAIKDINVDMIPVDEIVNYIEQDIEEKLAN